ncbi:MAG: 50S ribosomal protein L19e [Thaumarchaeota archaeon]|nr:50S ribosomal protein L19e [Nitrososphaerota archaeon]
MDVKGKKRLAADVLDVGVSRIKFDPNQLELIEDAITRGSIRGLVKDRVIWVVPAKGVSKGRHRIRKKALKKRGRSRGSKEGAEGARVGKKDIWVRKVRALRKELKHMKKKGSITHETFNKLYRQVKGGQVRNVRHLKELIKAAGKGA